MAEINWRRNWKPTLDTLCWISVPKTESLLMKFNCTESSYEFLLTDFQNIWKEEVSADDLIKKNKKLNPNVEAPVTKLLDHLKDNVELNKSEAEFTFIIKENDNDGSSYAVLSMVTKIADLPFKWKFTCFEEPSLLFEHLTQPLTMMVSELNRRQNVLIDLLKKKDKELQDLKSQGTKVSRKHLITEEFNEAAFTNSMATSKAMETSISNNGSAAFGDFGKKLYEDIMMKSKFMKKLAAGDIDEADIEAVGPSVGQSWADRLPASLNKSPAGSPKKSPAKSPAKSEASQVSPVKDSELLRRQALERRLQEEAEKKEVQKKKKKKLKL